jgi:tetratricopeptide (TPR) repeat protein
MSGGYVSLLCYSYPHSNRLPQAEYALQRALKLKLANDKLLEEIGDIAQKAYENKNPDISIVCYDRAIKANPNRGEVYQKYGNIVISYQKHEKSKGIDLLKKALEIIVGENNKGQIALVLQEALKEEGRDEEAAELAQYTQNMTTS